jgi:hypothetical protein
MAHKATLPVGGGHGTAAVLDRYNHPHPHWAAVSPQSHRMPFTLDMWERADICSLCRLCVTLACGIE